MDRYLLALALAVLAAIPLAGVVDRGALYEGKVIRLPDGRRFIVIGRDPDATGYWRFRTAHTPVGFVEFSDTAEALLAVDRGEDPLFGGYRLNPEGESRCTPTSPPGPPRPGPD